MTPEHQEPGPDAAKKPAKPAETTATEQQIRDRILSGEFNRPQQLGADESADDADDGRVGRRFRQPAPGELPTEDPDANECADGDEHAEARHLEVAYAEKDGIHRSVDGEAVEQSRTTCVLQILLTAPLGRMRRIP